jgi:hypothetical protein
MGYVIDRLSTANEPKNRQKSGQLLGPKVPKTSIECAMQASTG